MSGSDAFAAENMDIGVALLPAIGARISGARTNSLVEGRLKAALIGIAETFRLACS